MTDLIDPSRIYDRVVAFHKNDPVAAALAEDGHCGHCVKGCQGGRPISVDDPTIIGHDSASTEWGATWLVCPACAEAERITEWMLRAGHQRAADALQHDYPDPPSPIFVN